MRPGRNDPCTCGSGKKFKHCCEGKVASQFKTPSPSELNKLVALFNTFRYAELERQASFLLSQYPNSGFIWQLLGTSLKMQGKDSLYAFQKAAELLPNNAGAHSNLGVALKNVGQINDAIASYRRAIKIKPDFFDAHFNLGNALNDLGQLNDAVVSYRRSLEIKPNNANAHYNLGSVLNKLGQFDNALKSYRRALEYEPSSAEVQFSVGKVLHSTGQLEDAVASYRRVVEISPNFADGYNNLACALKDLWNLDDAETACLRALEINPNFAGAHGNLGNIYKDTGRLDEAVACYRLSVALDQNDTAAHSRLLYALYFHPDFDERMILAEVKQFGSSRNRATYPAVNSNTGRSSMSERRLRIGYVSPDFRDHCQSFFTIPLLQNHDHTQFEVYCYAQLVQPDDISNRLRAYSDVWRDTYLKSDPQVAEMIVNDRIDILIDLTMHMGNARPMLFALKPAPVQVAWLAYPGTTGLAAIDYRLTDPWLDPPELGDDRYTETSIRLPDTFWCYDPLVYDLQPNALPAEKNGYVTFGCLNNFCKVSDDTLCRWGQVMAQVPSSRLILLAPAGRHRQRIYDLLGRYDVAAERIEFVEFQPRLQYLQTYHRIDICLDTLPYNGHTTSLDAYWMGVPVVTQVGHTVVGRAGGVS